MLTSNGGIFGDVFDPRDVEFPDWGSLTLDLACDGGTATYDSTEEGFGSGTLNVIKLSNLVGLGCEDES